VSKLAGKFLKGEMIGKERCLSVSRSGRGATGLKEAVIEVR